MLPGFVRAFGFASAKGAGYEADDFVAAAASRKAKLGGTAIVASGDRDTYQLASERITILQPVRAGEMARIGPKEVRARYGVDPQRVPAFIALRGDASDRIPGAVGVGAVTAAGILRKHGSLEAAIAAGRFAREAEKLRLYRRIALMDRSAPLRPLRNQKSNWKKASALAGQWELKNLAKRLEALAAVTVSERRSAPAARPPRTR